MAEIRESVLKHGCSVDDAYHAIINALAVHDDMDDPYVRYLGPDTTGELLEVLTAVDQRFPGEATRRGGARSPTGCRAHHHTRSRRRSGPSGARRPSAARQAAPRGWRSVQMTRVRYHSACR